MAFPTFQEDFPSDILTEIMEFHEHFGQMSSAAGHLSLLASGDEWKGRLALG